MEIILNPQTNSSRVTRTLLVILLVFLSLSGLFGIIFLIDPSGASVDMPSSLLDKLPIDTFFLPGLYLLIVYGIGSAVIAYGFYRRLVWAPVAGLLIGLVLIGWVIGQIILWGEPVMLQVIYLTTGVAIFLLSLIIRKQGNMA